MTPRGVALELHPPGEHISDVIRRTADFYEARILDTLAPRLTGGVLVDAGANIGNHTAYLASFVKHSAIHAFEPWPDNLTLLRKNVAAYPTVTVHPQALSDRHRLLTMISEAANRGHSRIADDILAVNTDRQFGSVEVEAVTLDSFGFTDVTLLKIDVESHEPQVLAGAVDTILRCRPLVLIEDWTGNYGALLPGYRLVEEWGEAHQTYLYEW